MGFKIDKKIVSLLFLIVVLLFSIFFHSKEKQNSIISAETKITSQETKLLNFDKINFSLFFTGDSMLDRYNRTVLENFGATNIAREVKKINRPYDLRVTNLEGTVTDNSSVSVGTEISQVDHMKFTFDQKDTADFLKEFNFNVVNIGNNHILDFGQAGLQQTKEFLRGNEIDYFGDPYNHKAYLIKEIGDEKIAFVNYNQFFGPIVSETASLISGLKNEVDFLIVYTHWGDEYSLKENEFQRKTAYQFIDNGADLIIGTHPHVIQPIEIYKNKAIFYSLGNFFFDQYFSEEVKERLSVGVFINDEEAIFYLTPLYSNNQKITLAKKEKRKKILDRISFDSKVNQAIKNQIKQGEFFVLR